MAASCLSRSHHFELLHWTDAIGVAGATLLTGTNVFAIATAERHSDIREARTLPACVAIGVDSITDSRAKLDGVHENAANRARSNVRNVVDWPSTVRKATEVPRPALRDASAVQEASAGCRC